MRARALERSKQDRTVQARCIGLAKLGFFALAVDALGAGERGIGKALGEYHGEMVAATLWPVGQPLSGLQVYENMRAVDYLLTRKKWTASGWASRARAAAATRRCTRARGTSGSRRWCRCVRWAIFRRTSAWRAACARWCRGRYGSRKNGVYSVSRRRALMVINATRWHSVSVGEAKKSLALTRPIYALHGKPNSVKHLPVESKHDYNKPMREAMYGWMTLHEKAKATGAHRRAED